MKNEGVVQVVAAASFDAFVYMTYSKLGCV